MTNEPLYISIEGGIGASKSTLMKFLLEFVEKKGKKMVEIPEPVDQWKESGILDAFYQNVDKYAYTFQTVAFSTRVEMIKRKWRENPNAQIFISERCPLSDRLFVDLLRDSGSFDEPSFIAYQLWADSWESMVPKPPDLIVYLATPPEECLRRMKIRNRSSEVDAVDLDYQTKLIQKHDEKFGSGVAMSPSGKKIPVLILKEEHDFHVNENSKARIIRLLEERGVF